jgi:hypothetical protein
MTFPLTAELSRNSSVARPRRRSPSAALCLLALLGAAAACSGTIEGDDLDDSRAATSDSPNEGEGTQDTSTRARPAADDDTDVSAVGEDEQDEDDVQGINGRSRSTGSGGSRRSRADLDDELTDAGADDAGDVDGGVVEVDAGVDVDAGVVEVDAGVDLDGGAAP